MRNVALASLMDEIDVTDMNGPHYLSKALQPVDQTALAQAWHSINADGSVKVRPLLELARTP